MTDGTFPYYPVFLNIHGRRCLVVGGGPVAYRKAKALLEHGATVDVVSPELCQEMRALSNDTRVRIAPREYRTEDLRGVLLAIAATDNAETNQRVAREAKQRRILVNVVDDLESSGFIAPSYLRRGDVTIAVSTGGRSPALARKIRARLEPEFGDEYAHLARLLSEIRGELRRRGIKVSAPIWQEALALEPLLALLRERRDDEAKGMLLERLGVAAQLE